MENNLLQPDCTYDAFNGLDVSANTRKDYGKRLGRFITFMKDKGFYSDILLEYKRGLADNTTLSVSSKNKYLTSARIFLKEAYRKQAIPFDVTANVKSFKRSRGHQVMGLNQVQIEVIWTYINNLPLSLKTTRIRAIYCLLACQGLRQIEVVRLQMKDIDLDRGTAYIQGKGRDDKQMIYLHPATKEAIATYLEFVDERGGSLFFSLGNRKSKQLTTMTINMEMRKVFKEVGIKGRVHGLRHWYITALLGMMDVRNARKLSRHSSLDMLLVYDDEIATKALSERTFDNFGIR